ncbi:M48 family metallopeptidase [Henriciella aquimarina]|uniref:M48 family metallopeptidase n=1 Tax=Henriciella aquimarina TaxID=545261 RepID=UPI001301D987|nr:M48 family metallopeptidase [Henriciella aquimarina]
MNKPVNFEDSERIEIDSALLKDAPKINLSRRAIISGLAAGSVFPILSSCTTNPYTGQSELAFMGDDQIASMAASAWTDLKSQTPQTSNTRLKNRVLNVWSRIERVTPKAGEQWDVAVFDSDDVNAFVMPGNRVGVYRGIVDLAENDDQLSTVLGHEVGHTIYRHANRRMSRAMLAQGALAAGQVAVSSSDTLNDYGGAVAALGGAALQFGVVLPYSRESELEADRAGVDYMHSAGYDVKQSIRLWELMQANASSSRQPEFMSTHPHPGTRINELRQYINAKGYAII